MRPAESRGESEFIAILLAFSGGGRHDEMKSSRHKDYGKCTGEGKSSLYLEGKAGKA